MSEEVTIAIMVLVASVFGSLSSAIVTVLIDYRQSQQEAKKSKTESKLADVEEDRVDLEEKKIDHEISVSLIKTLQDELSREREYRIELEQRFSLAIQRLKSDLLKERNKRLALEKELDLEKELRMKDAEDCQKHVAELQDRINGQSVIDLKSP